MKNMAEMKNMEMFSGSPIKMFFGSPTEIFSCSPTLFTLFIHSIYGIYRNGLENMVLGQFIIGEHQMTSGALVSTYLVSLALVPMWRNLFVRDRERIGGAKQALAISVRALLTFCPKFQL